MCYHRNILYMEKTKNIITSCIHRTLGPCMEMFYDNIIDIYDKMSDKWSLFCAVFNLEYALHSYHLKTNQNDN